jgi:hypothetical protein
MKGLLIVNNEAEAKKALKFLYKRGFYWANYLDHNEYNFLKDVSTRKHLMPFHITTDDKRISFYYNNFCDYGRNYKPIDYTKFQIHKVAKLRLKK